MKLKFVKVLATLGIAAGVALTPGFAHADQPTTCHATIKCTLDGVFTSGPFFVSITANGPKGAKMLWYAQDAKDNFLCGSMDNLDVNGHYAKTLKCNAGVGPYHITGASNPTLMDWQISYHV